MQRKQTLGYFIFFLGLGVFIGRSAGAVEVPPLGPADRLLIQTTGPNASIGIGDYFSASQSQSGAGIAHVFSIDLPADYDLTTEVTVSIFDPESGNTWDEVRGSNDTTRFILRNPNGMVIADRTFAPGGGTDDSYIPLKRFTALQQGRGSYTLEVSTSDNDDNYWALRVEPDTANGSAPITIGTLKTSYQFPPSSPPYDETFWFYVLPGTGSLRLLNYDNDNNGAYTYTPPSGSPISGTVSGATQWNNPTGGGLAPATSGDIITNPAAGWWRVDLNNFESGNQFVVWPQNGFGHTLPHYTVGPSGTLPPAPEPALRLSPAVQQRFAAPNLALRYSLVVENQGVSPDVIDMTASSSAGLSWTFFTDPDGDGDPADGAALGDNDADGDADTGPLESGETLYLVAEATPAAGIPVDTIDTTDFVATSSLRTSEFVTSRADSLFYDTDGDGLLDAEEMAIGADRQDRDTDDDGVIDGDEPDRLTDTDGDGLAGPLDADSDNDGLADGTELGIDTPDADTNTSAAAFVPDADGGATTTDPLVADSDAGGVIDGSEDTNGNGRIDTDETDPNAPGDDSGVTDSDADGLADAFESRVGTHPNDADSDDDGITDGAEPNGWYDDDGDGAINARDPDADEDGLLDGTERGLTAPMSTGATDLNAGNFIGDADDSNTTFVLAADTDGGGEIDGSEDANQNGATDAGERDPRAPRDDDNDGDGLSDRTERLEGTDPTDADSDDDGVLDGNEPQWRSDLDGDGLMGALDADADGDGLLDGTELGLDAPEHPTDTDTAAGNFVADGDAGATVTNPARRDTDGGGVPDGQEDVDRDGVYEPANGETDPDDPADDGGAASDSDGDGLTDAYEASIGTDAADADSDDDGVLDGSERDLTRDTDADGTINALDPDADNDGIFDGTELGVVNAHSDTDTAAGTFVADADAGATTTSPVAADTDGGGTADGAEDANQNGALEAGETNPSDADDDDPDADGLTNGQELSLGTNGRDADTDEDGLTDGEEVGSDGIYDPGSETHPRRFDSDGDGIYDATELGRDAPTVPADTDLSANRFVADADAGATTTNPIAVDTDGDGLADGVEDTNADGARAADETDPLDLDSDDDGIDDGEERRAGADGFVTEPLLPDSDNDGLADGVETGLSAGVADPDGSGPLAGTDGSFTGDADTGATTTDPTAADSDNGGVADGTEDANQNGQLDAGERDPNDSVDDTCGDGVVQSPPEMCDDGGLSEGAGCSRRCQVAPGFVCRGAPSACYGPTTDPDGDALTVAQENTLGTDWFDPDTDADGVPDGEEVQPGADGVVTLPLDADSDDDGLSDGEELTAGRDGHRTRPTVADTDRDGLGDGLEVGGGNVPGGQSDVTRVAYAGTDSPVVDADPNTTTDPTRADTDAGGKPDGQEDTDHNGRVDAGETDPNYPPDDAPATCGDGTVDPAEGCDDANREGGDGCSAACVVEPGYACSGNPSACAVDTTDSDGDGISDQGEVRIGTDPEDADSDDDGLEDGAELEAGTSARFDAGVDTDPLDADTDDDGLADGEETTEGDDGFVTDPLHPDTDGDDLLDGLEVGRGPVAGGSSDGGIGFAGTGPLFVGDADAGAATTNPTASDTDAGGVPDGLEDANRDGKLDTGERDPNAPGDDVPDTCGNGAVESGEQCDDNNTAPADGCSAACVIEPGAICSGTPSVCHGPEADPDGDGISNASELAAGTDPYDADTDGDGLTDDQEPALGTNRLDADTDNDGLADGAELEAGAGGGVTDPTRADTDGDGLSDGLEVSANPVPAGQSSGSGVFYAGTDPGFVPDTDPATQTDPTAADTDAGGVADGLEDANRDGAIDSNERDPNDPADDAPPSCGDGAVDAGEACDDGNLDAGDGCSPLCLVEQLWHCKDTPSICEPLPGDADDDGIANEDELALGTDPLDADTDGDGLDDLEETTQGADGVTTDPTAADTDADGLTDGREMQLGTNPTVADTDHDGLSDGTEVNDTQTNPLEPLALSGGPQGCSGTAPALPSAWVLLWFALVGVRGWRRR